MKSVVGYLGGFRMAENAEDAAVVAGFVPVSRQSSLKWKNGSDTVQMVMKNDEGGRIAIVYRLALLKYGKKPGISRSAHRL